MITAGREGMRRREKKCKEGYRGNKESEKVKKKKTLLKVLRVDPEFTL